LSARDYRIVEVAGGQIEGDVAGTLDRVAQALKTA
jgi:hypothetical protein